MIAKYHLAIRSLVYSARRSRRNHKLDKKLKSLSGYKCDNVQALSRLVIFPKLGIGFNRVKKCANSSTLLHLAELELNEDSLYYGDSLESMKSNLLNNQLNIETHIDSFSTFDDLKWLIVVRNPFDRLLSCFLEKSNQAALGNFNYTPIPGLNNPSKDGFNRFVHYLQDGGLKRNGHWDLQVNQSCFSKDKYDLIAKVENLDEDLKSFLTSHVKKTRDGVGKLGVGVHSIEASDSKKITKAHTRRYEFYDKEIEDLVCQIYEPDFQAWNYPMEL